MADTLTKEQRSYCMSRIRSKDTGIEIMLRKGLFKRGLRYRVNYKKLPGSPDIVFVKPKIAIFIDGDFWHGRDFGKRRHTYNKYWTKKIIGNMKRDIKIDKKLKTEGWEVVRIWGSELKRNLEKYVEKIEKRVKK